MYSKFSKRLVAVAVSGLILAGATTGLVLDSGVAVAKGTKTTLKVKSFANTSADFEGGAKALFECNAATGTWTLDLTGIDVTSSAGSSFVSESQNLYLTVGPDIVTSAFFTIPLSQNDTNGLWQVGTGGSYSGNMPTSDCTSGSQVIIDPGSIQGQAVPEGGWAFDYSGTL